MIFIELIIILLLIYMGCKSGGMALGLFGTFGVLILTVFFHKKIGNIPFDVIEIILSVIITISTVKLSGGIEYLVFYMNKILSKNKKYIIIVSPIMTYCITLLSGTGHTALSIFPVIINISKKNGIKPVYPLSISVVASQIGVTASPISASLIYLSKILDPLGISYNQLLIILIPSTFISILITSIIISLYNIKKKNSLNTYNFSCNKKIQNKKNGKYSILLFLIGIITILIYNILCDYIFSNQMKILSRTESIIIFMLTTALIISIICKIKIKKITSTNIFKSGINACICVMGVSWLGDTFIKSHIHEMKFIILNIVQQYPWMLSIILFFITSLFYSQAATTKAIIPSLITLGISPKIIIGSFTAISALFLFPIYPTILSAVEMDDTGSTKIGNYVFNHSFLIPGIIITSLSIILSFFIERMIL
ncbi:anaerobic C4-dicarboxylate transporter family protein [Enterobacteriaceae endosymbiont of Plateumaris rustica]|uniref:anaerobic C4-dicarboxylate transporter family protein n=1 Tax=Enterobacteriaceae endosymbiont of Plateumaris rustica TaxID=2675796 RepID=UPI001449F89A|nr:anaerobic C4-dicarboxylate transporter family protein [Enterobacteriaceae endosymbiont of Plateumaris rustica]QJC29039.1 anaerobic C4-dicarboxylate transporter [Enterobacteriaceae endosymbiont of Plateumaris rustica]